MITVEEILKKHGLSPEGEEAEAIRNALREVATAAWFGGVNFAFDRADGVKNGHPDRKRFFELMFANPNTNGSHQINNESHSPNSGKD